MEISCLVLEDDELAAKSIVQIISKIDRLNCVGHFENPLEAKNQVDFDAIDLIFLDVEMPEISGIEFVKTLKTPPKIIITTSKKDFAFGAFEIEAVDFILKPVTLKAVLGALEKFDRVHESQPTNKVDSIFVKVDSKLVNLKLESIEWIEALGDYAGFQVNGKRYVVKTTLAAIEEKIGNEAFVRVHRSYIVNVNWIRDIDDSSLVINGKLIPISRNNRQTLMRKLNLLK